MGNQHSTWSGFKTKELAIPDNVRVGAAIGKRGGNIKSLQEIHGIRCTVNGDYRNVTLRWSEAGMNGAEDDLANLFASFDIAGPARNSDVQDAATSEPSQRCGQPNRCTLHVLNPSVVWSFERERVRLSDENVKTTYIGSVKSSGKTGLYFDRFSFRRSIYIAANVEDTT